MGLVAILVPPEPVMNMIANWLLLLTHIFDGAIGLVDQVKELFWSEVHQIIPGQETVNLDDLDLVVVAQLDCHGHYGPGSLYGGLTHGKIIATELKDRYCWPKGSQEFVGKNKFVIMSCILGVI